MEGLGPFYRPAKDPSVPAGSALKGFTDTLAQTKRGVNFGKLEESAASYVRAFCIRQRGRSCEVERSCTKVRKRHFQ